MTEDIKVAWPERARPWYYWLTYIWTWPHDILTFVLVLIIWALWGTRLSWNEGLWCELKPNSWPARSWYRYKKNGKYQKWPEYLHEKKGKWITWGGTTLGHGGFYGPAVMTEMYGEQPDDHAAIDTKIEYHEHVHVDQFEGNMLRGFLVGLLLFTCIAVAGGDVGWAAALGFTLWITWAWIVGGTNFLQAVVRGEEAYRGSVHEEAAYDAAADFIRKKYGR